MKKKKILLFIVIALVVAALATGAVFWIDRAEKRRRAEKSGPIDREYYNEKVAAFAEENKTLSSVDVVFLGDSLTDGCDVARYYPDYRCLNRGIAGDTTYGLLERLSVSVLDVDCRAIVLLIGANNIRTMFDNYEEILRTLSERKPGVPVIVLSLSALGRDWTDLNRTAVENNRVLKPLAEKYGYTFVDIFTVLQDPQTGAIVEAYTSDGCHWTHEGYCAVTDQVNRELAKILKAFEE